MYYVRVYISLNLFSFSLTPHIICSACVLSRYAVKYIYLLRFQKSYLNALVCPEMVRNIILHKVKIILRNPVCFSFLN